MCYYFCRDCGIYRLDSCKAVLFDICRTLTERLGMRDDLGYFVDRSSFGRKKILYDLGLINTVDIKISEKRKIENLAYVTVKAVFDRKNRAVAFTRSSRRISG